MSRITTKVKFLSTSICKSSKNTEETVLIFSGQSTRKDSQNSSTQTGTCNNEVCRVLFLKALSDDRPSVHMNLFKSKVNRRFSIQELGLRLLF